MQKVKCSDCGKVYDRDSEFSCPECGSDNYRLPKSAKSNQNNSQEKVRQQVKKPAQATQRNNMDEDYGYGSSSNSGYMENEGYNMDVNASYNNNSGSGDLKPYVLSWIKLMLIMYVPIFNIVYIVMSWKKLSMEKKGWILAGLIVTGAIFVIFFILQLVCCGSLSAMIGSLE